jgi:hypothetical protein
LEKVKSYYKKFPTSFACGKLFPQAKKKKSFPVFHIFKSLSRFFLILPFLKIASKDKKHLNYSFQIIRLG